MKRSSLLLLFSLFATWGNLAKAQTTLDNHRSITHLLDSGLVVINTPYTKNDTLGKVEVIQTSDSSLLYQMTSFLKFENYFTQNGEYHVQLNPYCPNDSTPENALTFYQKGRIIHTVLFSELYTNLNVASLPTSVWKKEAFIAKGKLYILTTNGYVMVFNATSGTLLDTSKRVVEFEQFRDEVDSYYVEKSEYLPLIECLKTNKEANLETLLRQKLDPYYTADVEFLTIYFCVYPDGSVHLSEIKRNGNQEFSQKDLSKINKKLKKIKLTEFTFYPGFTQWNETVIIRK